MYDELMTQLQAHTTRWRALAEALAEADLLCGFAARARRGKWSRPRFVGGRRLRIAGGRHPVVEAQVRHFVANDLELSDAARVCLVTGPNMGGKSTYLRQTALIVVLAYCGSFVPATSAEVGDFGRIYTRIGAADDLAGGASTFMLEMTEVAEILNNAGEDSLVLLDEIGRGTATFDGLALAWATMEALLDANGALALFATHYFELTNLAEERPAAFNAHVSAKERQDGIVFLWRVRAGAASRSYGIQVARLAGAPAAVVARAGALLKSLEKRAAPAAALPLFGAPAAAPPPAPAQESPALAALKQVNPNELSPQQALNTLYDLQKLLTQEEEQ